MAKKKEKSSKDSADEKAKGSKPADAVIGAIEQAFAAAAGGAAQTRGRAQDLVEDITSATNRVRDTLDDLRVLEDLKGLRAELETLATRVAALEVQQAAQPEPEPERKPATRRSSTRSTSRSGSASPPRASTGTKPAGTRTAAGTSSRSRSSSSGTRSTPRRTPKAAPTDPAPDASAGRS